MKLEIIFETQDSVHFQLANRHFGSLTKMKLSLLIGFILSFVIFSTFVAFAQEDETYNGSMLLAPAVKQCKVGWKLIGTQCRKIRKSR